MVLYDGYKDTYSFKVNEKKIALTLLQPSKTNPLKKEVCVLLSYGECKGELEREHDVLALVVVEKNEHKEPPASMKPILKEFHDVIQEEHQTLREHKELQRQVDESWKRG